jgi:hypothetical protein
MFGGPFSLKLTRMVRTHPWRSFGARSPEMLKRSPQITQHRSRQIPVGCVQKQWCVARWDNSTLPKSMRHQNSRIFFVHP